MAANKNTNPSDDWKNNWKNSWKDPAFQNIDDDVYRYQRESDKSKWQQWKEIQKNQKSEYIGIRKQARKDNMKLLLPVIGTALVIGLVLYMVFFV